MRTVVPKSSKTDTSDSEDYYNQIEALEHIITEKVFFTYLAKSKQFLNEARYVGRKNAEMYKKLKLLFSENMPNDLVYFISNLSGIHKKLLELCQFLLEFNSKDKITNEYDDAIDFRDAFSSPTIYFAAQVESFKTELKTTLPLIKKSSKVSNPDKLAKELLNLEIVLIKLQEDLAKQMDKIINLTNELIFAKRKLTLGNHSHNDIIDWASKLRESK